MWISWPMRSGRAIDIAHVYDYKEEISQPLSILELNCNILRGYQQPLEYRPVSHLRAHISAKKVSLYFF